MIGQPPVRVPRPGQRRWFLIIALALFLLFFAGSIARFYTDALWFGELGFSTVFYRTLWTKIGIGVVGGVIAAVFIWTNLELAFRSRTQAPLRLGPVRPSDQYRSMVGGRARLLNVAVSAVMGVLTGLSASSAWSRFLLWRNAQQFNVKDPYFGRDVSFFVFKLPFQHTLLSAAFSIVILTLLLAIGAHLLHGSIDIQPRGIRVATSVKIHISVLGAILALLKAWGYVLAQYDLSFSRRGIITAAGYTDLKVQLPALKLLVLIASISAVIFLVNLHSRFRGWLLPAAAVGLWAFASIVIGAVIPGVIQRFVVTPNASQRELPYIKRNIEATREAFDLKDISLTDFPADNELTATDLQENRATTDNLRIWDPAPLLQTIQRRQGLRQYYDFRDVDIDRYTLDGSIRQVLISARELNLDGLDERAQNWINQRLTYTHGYGVVATAANSVTQGGEPDYLVEDLPPTGPEELVPSQAALYFGEGRSDYVIVGTKQKEVRFASGAERETTYNGKGGIELSGPLRKSAFALRFADTNILLSNLLTPKSKVLMRRDIMDRVRTVAPFLRYDHDPYLVVADDRSYWVIDGYTGTDRYPNSQEIDLAELFQDQSGDVNYMRNSVKVIIDAFDGTTTFYNFAPNGRDPIIDTYQAIFPKLFRPASELPESIRPHLRYPEQLFVVQSNQYRLYHETNPSRFFDREDFWEIAGDPVHSTDELRIPMEPYYVVMQLPGSDKPEFLLMIPFTPRRGRVLNGWMAARMDGDNYGEIVGFTFPRNRTIEGPQNVASQINQNDIVSQQKSLWDRSGSRVVEGNLFVVPVGTSLIYVQSYYLQAERGAQPDLERVVVVSGSSLGFEPTLEAALAKAIAGGGGTVTAPSEGTKPAEPSGDFASLLRQADEHFQRADQALREGDLATYQRENQAARDAVRQALTRREESNAA